MAVLRNVKVEWAQVQKPDVKFTPQWHITCVLDAKHLSQLKEESTAVDPKGKGVKFGENENGDKTYKFKRFVERKDGKGNNNQPVIVDYKGSPFKDLIGNGSLCDVQYAFMAYNNTFGKGVTSDLKGIMVKELVPYGSSADGAEFEFDNSERSESKDRNSYDDGDFN